VALERKDVRLKLDADKHGGLAVLAEVDQLDIGEWCERVITAEIERRIHAATVIADRAARLGISGKNGER
jgi:hypothetical protein